MKSPKTLVFPKGVIIISYCALGSARYRPVRSLRALDLKIKSESVETLTTKFNQLPLKGSRFNDLRIHPSNGFFIKSASRIPHLKRQLVMDATSLCLIEF